MNCQLRNKVKLSKAMILVLGAYSVSGFALDVTDEFKSVGEFDDLNVNITSADDIDAVKPSVEKSDPSMHQSVVLNGKTFVTVNANTIIGFRVLDQTEGGKNYSVSLTANDDVKIDITAKKVGYGILMGAAEGKKVNPDGIPMGGFVKINGAIDININAGSRAGGVIAGGFFGNSIAGDTTGTVEFGKYGHQNTITLTGGKDNSNSAEPGATANDDDKMVGILGYSTNQNQASVKAYGSTTISISTEKIDKPLDVNRGTFGIYASRNSDMLFEDKEGALSVYLTSSEQQRRRLDGIVSGLYDAIFVGNSKITVNEKTTNVTFGTGANVYGISSYAHSLIDLNTNLTIKAIDATSMSGLFATHYAGSGLNNRNFESESKPT